MSIIIHSEELDEGLDRMAKAQPIPVSRVRMARSILQSAISEFDAKGDAEAWRNGTSVRATGSPAPKRNTKPDASPSIPGNTPSHSGSATPLSKPTGSASSATPAPARASAATPSRPCSKPAANGSKPKAHSPKPKAASKAQPVERRAGANLGSFVAKPA